jgi:putative ABC transport system substrate-binding protein
LRELNYAIGKSVILDYRFAEGRFDRLPTLAAELVRSKPDVLVAHTTPGSLAAKRATQDIPIVMVGIADPIGVGLVTSLARPSGNITGITNITAELAGKRLELLKEIVPRISQVAVFVNPDDANAQIQMKNAESAALALGIRLHPVIPMRNVSDVDRAFTLALKEGAGAAIRMVDPMSSATRQRTAELTLKHRLPVIYAFRQDAEAGSLIAYGTNLPDQFRRAATYVDKILKGTKPADLPVEQPTTFELAINLKTAKALGIAIPPTIMLQATRVIE